MYDLCVCACACVIMCMSTFRRPEEGIALPEVRVTGSYKLPDRGVGN